MRLRAGRAVAWFFIDRTRKGHSRECALGEGGAERANGEGRSGRHRGEGVTSYARFHLSTSNSSGRSSKNAQRAHGRVVWPVPSASSARSRARSCLMQPHRGLAITRTSGCSCGPPAPPPPDKTGGVAAGRSVVDRAEGSNVPMPTGSHLCADSVKHGHAVIRIHSGTKRKRAHI